MCQDLRGSQFAGHPRKIGNTLLKSGPFRGSQYISSRATGCTPLFYSSGSQTFSDRVPFVDPVLSTRTTLFQENSMCQI